MNVDRLLENLWRVFDLVLARRFMFAGIALGGSASMMAYGMNPDQMAAILLKLNAEIFVRAEEFGGYLVAVVGEILQDSGSLL